MAHHRRFLSLASLTLVAPAFAAEPPVSFNRDIRPIMSDTCFHCHGFDAKSRKAGMRLDLREEALKETKSGALPIVPGQPDKSEIIIRINDVDEPMPPEDAHKALTRAQKDLFRRWIAEGAVYEPHWAYAPLTKPAVPAAASLRTPPSAPRTSPNPVDAFIRAKLAEKKITPSAEAPAARLLRRLSLDLTGLPPTPQEVAAFVADRSPDAYAKQVERLLSSPRHGERLAVWWLDLARYADTVGFHGDQNQRIFPYRDYVINAFNANKRFDQFTREQLAGDLLPNPTPEQIVATGYNRLNMMTREGGAQPKEYLAKYGAERVRSVAAAWFGSTFGCAECHDHKFDPIKTRDFYELQSFFADVKQWGVYSDYVYTPNPDLFGFNNDYPFPPEIEVDSPYLRARKQRLEADLVALRETVRAQVDAPTSANADAFATWVAESRAFLEKNPSGWQQPAVTAAVARGNRSTPADELTIGEDRVVRPTQELKRGETLRVTLRPGAGRLAALRLETVALPPLESDAKKRANRMPVRLSASVRGVDGRERKLDFAFADASAKEPRYDGGAEVIGIVSGWKIPLEPAAKSPLTATWLLAAPPVLGADDTVVLTLNGEALPAFVVLASPFADVDPAAVASDALRTALRAGYDDSAAAKVVGVLSRVMPASADVVVPAPTPEQKRLLSSVWLSSTAADRTAFERQQQLAAKIRATRDGRAWSLITEAAPQPLTVRVLPRGNWQDESGAVVLPSTPSFLPARRESTPDKRLTRLDLANYIVSKENPITARVVMNRLWAMYFGTGLSAVIDDLGSQGELPSHPELLDWLASEFRDSGWDLRHMIRLIVTSATYRQSSSLRPELRDIDPNNRLLASQNPRRVEAEFVRDTALSVAGLLNTRDLGGPSMKPYQPPGYYAALQFPDRDYIASADDEQWRRGVYMHWQRTFLHPMLANFDAPARDECAAARTVSNTPQQALTLLNDPTFVEAARVFATRLVYSPHDGDDESLRHAFQLALGREPKPQERTSLTALLAAQRTYYREHADDAQKLMKVGLTPTPANLDAAEIAAWTQVTRVVLNLQEFFTRY